MKAARPTCLLAAICWLSFAAAAFGQRIQIPSPPPTSSAAPAPTYGSSAAPSYGPPASPAPATAAPLITFDGTIQPPPVDWDPYAPPGASAPALLPQDPYYQPGQAGIPAFSVATMQKFLQQVRGVYLWMPGKSSDELGVQDVEVSATFAIPFLYNTETPLLVTPGFAFHFWDGPKPPEAELPPRTYDAFLDTQWNPQINQVVGGELDFRIGVYSDFENVTSQSVLFTGRGLLTLSFSPSFKIKGGIWYLDRVRVKMLPAGGVVWTPNSDARFDILFPNPRIAWRLSTWGTTDWWIFAAGEYGGGSWTVERTVGGLTFNDQFDYNDYRVSVGLEFIRQRGLSGFFEIGLSWEREVVFRSGSPTFNPNNTVFLRTGLAY